MGIVEKMRIKIKIRKLCNNIKKYENREEMICIIKNALRQLPKEKKEGLLDVCIKVVS